MTWLKLFFSKVWDFLRPLAELLMTRSGQILASAALAAVRTVGETYADADGETKRRTAFAAIVDDLKSSGIELGVEITTSMINAAIEAALQRVKAKG